MKKLCECNSNCEVDYEASMCIEMQRYNNCVSFEYPGDWALSGREVEKCQVCGYYFWYDANYENMMLDLRSMNTIW